MEEEAELAGEFWLWKDFCIRVLIAGEFLQENFGLVEDSCRRILVAGGFLQENFG